MDNREELIKEAKRIEEDSLHSAKGHFAAARRWSQVHFWIGIIATIVAAVAGASALSKFDYHATIAGALAIIVAVLNAVATFINPQENAAVHLKSGNKYNALKNDSRIFYNIEVSNEKAVGILKKLSDRRHKLNKECPQIPPWAFKKAKIGIDCGESNYHVDKANQ